MLEDFETQLVSEVSKQGKGSIGQLLKKALEKKTHPCNLKDWAFVFKTTSKISQPYFPTGSHFHNRHKKVCIKSCKPQWSCWGNPLWVCMCDGRHNTGNQRLLRLTQSMFQQFCFAQLRNGLVLIHWGPCSLMLMDIAAKSLWISILYNEQGTVHPWKFLSCWLYIWALVFHSATIFGLSGQKSVSIAKILFRILSVQDE